MKKFFLSVIASLMTVLSFATVNANDFENQTDASTSAYGSSVTVKIAGINNEFNFKTATLSTIFNLMPGDFKGLCIDAYKQVSSRLGSANGTTFYYSGVKIIETKTQEGYNLEFNYQGHKLTVHNYSNSEFNKFFGL